TTGFYNSRWAILIISLQASLDGYPLLSLQMKCNAFCRLWILATKLFLRCCMVQVCALMNACVCGLKILILIMAASLCMTVRVGTTLSLLIFALACHAPPRSHLFCHSPLNPPYKPHFHPSQFPTILSAHSACRRTLKLLNFNVSRIRTCNVVIFRFFLRCQGHPRFLCRLSKLPLQWF